MNLVFILSNLDDSHLRISTYEASQIVDTATQLHYQHFPEEQVLDVVKSFLTTTTGLLNNSTQNTKDVIMHLMTSQSIDYAACKRLCEDQAFTNILKIRLRSAEPHIMLFTSACIERAKNDQVRWEGYSDNSFQPYNAIKLISILSTIQERLMYFLGNMNLDPDRIPNVTFATIES